MAQKTEIILFQTLENLAEAVPIEKIPVIYSMIYQELYNIKLLSENFNVKNKKIIDHIFDHFKIEEGMSYIKSMQMNASPDGPSFTYLDGQKGGTLDGSGSNHPRLKEEAAARAREEAEEEARARVGVAEARAREEAEEGAAAAAAITNSSSNNGPASEGNNGPASEEVDNNIIAMLEISSRLRSYTELSKTNGTIVDTSKQLGLSLMDSNSTVDMTRAVLKASAEQRDIINQRQTTIEKNIKDIKVEISEEKKRLDAAREKYRMAMEIEQNNARDEFKSKLELFQNSMWWKKFNEQRIAPGTGAVVMGSTAHFGTEFVNLVSQGVVWGGMTLINFLSYEASMMPGIGSYVPELSPGILGGPNGECRGYSEYYVPLTKKTCKDVDGMFYGKKEVCEYGDEFECRTYGEDFVVPLKYQMYAVGTFVILGGVGGYLCNRIVSGRAGFVDIEKPGIGEVVVKTGATFFSGGLYLAVQAVLNALTDSKKYGEQKEQLELQKILQTMNDKEVYVNNEQYVDDWMERWRSLQGVGHLMHSDIKDILETIKLLQEKEISYIEEQHTLEKQTSDMATKAMETVSIVDTNKKEIDTAKLGILGKLVDAQQKEKENLVELLITYRNQTELTNNATGVIERYSTSRDGMEGQIISKTGDKKRKRKKSTKKRRKVKRKKTKRRRRKRTKRKRRTKRKKTKKN